MRRREFISGLAGAAALPALARAQAKRAWRVGVLMNGAATGAEYQTYLAAFTEGLHRSGWTEGQDFHIDVRWNDGDVTLARRFATELIGLTPDVILAASTVNLAVVRLATRTVPVVFVGVADPVAQGFVGSVRQPGGNLTGFSLFEISLGGKWLDLLKQVAPGIERVALMYNPDTAPYSKFFMSAIADAAPAFGVQAVDMPVRAGDHVEPALANFARAPNGGLMLLGDSFVVLRYPMIIDLAGRYRLPSIAPGYNFARDGGLIEYGPTIDLVGQFRQAAAYVDRVLKGSKPSDLPVQAPTNYRLAINMKTARTLGLTAPETLLATADEVIQ